jgi:protocatechuate 3,4-dioxygenase beta subunit
MRQSYIPNTPLTTALVPPDLILQGSPLMIFGTVYASDCRTPLPDTLIEVWHADTGGHYDDSPPFILRGQMRTDAKGRYQFTSIKPGRSQLGPETPPANIHFRVSHMDEPALFTQLFFAGDPLLSRFPFARPPLITTLTEQVGPEAMILRGKFDIILPISPTTSISTD